VNASADSLARLTAFYATLTPASLTRIPEFYAADAYFKDPFNEVHAGADIQRIFAHMFETLHDPRFVIEESVAQGSSVFLVWRMLFRVKRWNPNIEQTIRGVSHLRFGVDGKVVYHRDYWDAAEELYDKLPVAGSVVRFLKRRLR
jgi:steroid Delta-isomerase